MARTDDSFVHHCCELLAAVGPLRARRMFGGWGISTDGLTFALVADLGDGETLWLKSDEATHPRFEAAGCRRFTYAMRGVARSMGYYSAPEEALESPQLMAPWARQAFECALRAQSARRPRGAATSQASRARPPARRATAPAASPRAARKSAKG